MEKSQPVFSAEDVNRIRNPFVRLARIILRDRGITMAGLTQLHAEYWQRNRREERLFATHTGNLRRKLASTEKMTLKTFLYVITDVLRLNIKRVTITVVDRNGEEKTYSSDTIVQ